MAEDPGSRRLSATVARYVVAAGLWLGFAQFVVTPLIVSAYHGRTMLALTRLMPGRASLPLEHYLNAWNSFSGAALLALATHLALLLAIGRAANRQTSGRQLLPLTNLRGRARLQLALFAAAFLALTVVSGARHDYLAHRLIWRAVLEGTDPWRMADGDLLNAYGPLVTTLAPLTLVNALAPKLLLAGAFLGFVSWLARRFASPSGDIPGFLLAGAVLNPLAWIEIAWFGHFDVLVGIACVTAVHARVEGRDAASGLALGLGTLLKFLPIVLFPFLVVDRWRLRSRLDLACVMTIAIGLSATFQLAGAAVLRPMTLATTRGPEQLSIHRFLIGQWSPVGDLLAVANLSLLAMCGLAAAGALVFATCWLHNASVHTGAVAGMLTTLLFYQVGFVQYQLVLLMLVLYWIPTLPDASARTGARAVPFAVVAYFAWLALYDGFYAAIGGFLTPSGGWTWVADVVGLPTFVLGCCALVAILRTGAVSPAGGRLKFRETH